MLKLLIKTQDKTLTRLLEEEKYAGEVCQHFFSVTPTLFSFHAGWGLEGLEGLKSI